MDFSRAASALVDGRDLRREDEADRRLSAGRGKLSLNLAVDVASQGKEAWFSRDELVSELLKPERMREVARGDERQSLAPAPQREVFEIAVAAGGARIPGVDVQVREEGHGVRPSFLRWKDDPTWPARHALRGG